MRPRYLSSHSSKEPVQALLAIGDEALRLTRKGDYPFVLDLAELWHQRTELPFVFAVWAVREDFYLKHHNLVIEVRQELLRCIDEGKANLAAIAAKAAPRIPMSTGACHSYLQGIEYDLTEQKKKALQLFFQYLIGRSEAPKEALPVKFCHSLQQAAEAA